MNNLKLLIIFLFPLVSYAQLETRSGKLKLDSTIQNTYFYPTDVWSSNTKWKYEYNNFGSITSQTRLRFDYFTKLWTNLKRENYEYDHNDNLTQYTNLTWNSTLNVWDTTNQNRFTYTPNNQVSSLFGFTWNYTFNHLDSNYISNYSHNQNGDLTSRIDEKKEQNIWTPLNKEIYVYNQLNQDTLYEYSYWDSANSQWFLSGKTFKNYDSNGILTYRSKYYFDETLLLWLLHSKNMYTYNATGKVITDSVIIWDQNLQIIRNSSLYTTQYNQYGDPQEYNVQFWNNALLSWVNYNKFTKYYTQTVLDSSIHSKWNKASLEFINDKKTSYETQLNGELTLKNNFYWDQNNQNWLEQNLTIDTLDLSISKSSLIHPEKFNQYDYLLKSSGYYQTFSPPSGWSTLNVLTTFYSPISPNSVQNLVPISVLSYPNPTSNYVQFKIKNTNKPAYLFIYNTKGELLLTEFLHPGLRTNIKHLPSGNYPYAILINGQLHKGQIVKQ